MKNLITLLLIVASLNVFSQDTWEYDDTIILTEYEWGNYSLEFSKDNKERKEKEKRNEKYCVNYSYLNQYSLLWVPYQVTNDRRNYVVKSHLNRQLSYDRGRLVRERYIYR
jgi:hypothetical protein